MEKERVNRKGVKAFNLYACHIEITLTDLNEGGGYDWEHGERKPEDGEESKGHKYFVRSKSVIWVIGMDQ